MKKENILREDGWYWVSYYGLWKVCEYRKGVWLFDKTDAQPWTDESFEFISERLQLPLKGNTTFKSGVPAGVLCIFNGHISKNIYFDSTTNSIKAFEELVAFFEKLNFTDHETTLRGKLANAYANWDTRTGLKSLAINTRTLQTHLAVCNKFIHTVQQYIQDMLSSMKGHLITSAIFIAALVGLGFYYFKG